MTVESRQPLVTHTILTYMYICFYVHVYIYACFNGALTERQTQAC